MLPLFVTNHLDFYVFGGAYLAWVAPEMISSFVHGGVKGGQSRDRASRLVLFTSLFGSIFFAFAFAFGWPQFAISRDRGLVFSVGILFMLAGVALRWYAISVLGRYFTRAVAIRSEQTVVERGPYRYIRHPSYTGSIMTMLGMGLVLTNWLSLGLIMLGAAVGYGYRVRVEERALLEGLGQPYREYMKRTKRFIPFIF